MDTPPIYGYGEDALTLWVVSGHLREFLSVLEDPTPVADSKVFYRPSFGRKGSSDEAAGPQQWRAAFGEFDAVVGTAHRTYLIESKWTRSAENPGRTRSAPLRLGAKQVRRHGIMRSYIETWRAMQPANWAEFVQRSDIQPRLAAFNASVPKMGTRLARQLQITLGLMDDCGPVEDVLLFLRGEGGALPGEVEPGHFTLVGVDVRDKEMDGYLFLPHPALQSSRPPKMWLGPMSRIRRDSLAQRP